MPARYYRVLTDRSWEIPTIDEDGNTQRTSVSGGDLFCCYGPKDYGATSAFERVDVDADYIAILKRRKRLRMSTDEIAREPYAEIRAITADLHAGTRYAPTSQKKDDLLAFLHALDSIDPLPIAQDETEE